MKVHALFEQLDDEFSLPPRIPIKKTGNRWHLMDLDEAKYHKKLTEILNDAWHDAHQVSRKESRQKGHNSVQEVYHLHVKIYEFFVKAVGNDMITKNRLMGILQSDKYNTKYDILEEVRDRILNKKFGVGKRQFQRANERTLRTLGITRDDIQDYIE